PTVRSDDVPRLPRSLLPQRGIYHVTTKGVDGCTVYRDDGDRRLFLTLLIHETERLGWRVHAFTLMTTHYHLLVETELPLLSAGLQRLNGIHAQEFNARHRGWGQLWGERFACWVVRDEEHYENAV